MFLINRNNRKRVSIALPAEQPPSPAMEEVVRLRRSENYLKFPQYREDGSVTTTILPAILLPKNSARKRRNKHKPRTPSSNTVKLPSINIAKSDSKLERSTSMQYKPLINRKKTIKTRSTNLGAVAELVIPPIANSPDNRSAKRRPKKFSGGSAGSRTDIPNTPKILISESDSNNFSARNIQESKPGE